MKKKIILIMLFLILSTISISVEAGARRPIYILYEHMNEVGHDGDYVSIGNYFEPGEPLIAQTFHVGYTGPNEPHLVKYIDLYLHKAGTIESVTLSIRKVSPSEEPGSLSIASATIGDGQIQTNPGWARFYMNQLMLTTSCQYAIVLLCKMDDWPQNEVLWHCDYYNEYSGGNSLMSYDNENSWASSDTDMMFRIYGIKTKVYEHLSGTLGNMYEGVQINNWKAQTFRVGNTGIYKNHYTCNFKLALERFGYVSSMTVHLKKANPITGPYGRDLATKTISGIFAPLIGDGFEWIDFTIPQVYLKRGRWYAVCLSIEIPNGADPDDNCILWRGAGNAWPVQYPGGNIWISQDGITWGQNLNSDLLFEEYGLV